MAAPADVCAHVLNEATGGCKRCGKTAEQLKPPTPPPAPAVPKK